MQIRAMLSSDWQPVSAIYAEGLATRNATFQTEVPTWEQWDTGHRQDCRLVSFNETHEITGWVALSPVSSRACYAGVAEHSIYIGNAYKGQGIGKILLKALIEASEAAGIWTLQSSIFVENTASLKLHEQCGFRAVGQRERIAQLEGVWRTTVFMERRSAVVGV
jgi:phosphinothricin acetyltransferase